MPEPKTKPTDSSVPDFLDGISDERVRLDSWAIHNLMEKVAQAPGQMWGSAIVGYGKYTQTGSNGKSNEWPLIGFSPRKQAMTLYLNLGGITNAEELFAKLGKHSVSKGCLYIKHLSDVDVPILTALTELAYDHAVKTKLG